MRRNRFEIMAEILRAAKNGATKTYIMYRCNLSWRMTQRFLIDLLEIGFLRIGNSYHTTEKGLRFLQAYQTLQLLLTK